MKRKLNYYWLFRIVVKWLIPVMFFVIASAEGKAYWIGGVMTILVLAYYILVWQKVGDNKWDIIK